MSVSRNQLDWAGEYDDRTKQHISNEITQEEMDEKGFLKFTRYINTTAYISTYGFLSYLKKLASPGGRRDSFYYCKEHNYVFKSNLRNLIKVYWRHLRE